MQLNGPILVLILVLLILKAKAFIPILHLEVEAIVPSKWLSWLKPKQSFQFVIDETGAEVSVRIVRLGAVVDPISQTIKVYGVLDEKNNLVLPGMSGTATFHNTDS